MHRSWGLLHRTKTESGLWFQPADRLRIGAVGFAGWSPTDHALEVLGREVARVGTWWISGLLEVGVCIW